MNYLKSVLFLILMMSFSVSRSAVLEDDTYSLEIYPKGPTTAEETFLNVTVDRCHSFIRGEQGVSGNRAVFVDASSNGNKEIRVSIGVEINEFSPCLPPDDPQYETVSLSLGKLDFAGEYKVYFYSEALVGALPFRELSLIGTFTLSVKEPSLLVTPEVPQAGSIQSGVGIIRGWACDAREVEIAFDNGARIPVAYGTSRGDTRDACGDDNNGYGMVFAWGLLGKGNHQMKTFIDDNEVSDVSFEVAGLDGVFVTGLSGTYELDDFPAPGESVTVEWSESDQNFIIIDKQ